MVSEVAEVDEDTEEEREVRMMVGYGRGMWSSLYGACLKVLGRLLFF